MGESQERSHGRIGVGDMRRQIVPTRDLSDVPLLELATELDRRLEARANAATYNGNLLQYSVLDVLQRRIAAAIDVHPNRFSTASVRCLLEFPHRCHEQFGLPIHGSHHVDLGCGSLNPFGRMFTHLMLGVDRATCFELDPPPDLARSLRHLAYLASMALTDPARLFPGIPISRRTILDNLEGLDLSLLAQGDPRGLTDRLRFVPRSIVDTGLPAASVDVTFSNSVLEHLPDPAAFLQELARITRPGGLGIHGIDVADHRRYGDPSLHALEFLTEPGAGPIAFECNRLRLADHERLFAAHGFEVLLAAPAAPIPVPDTLRARFVEPWRSMATDDLHVTWCNYLIRRR